jgi:DNA-binding transcriptional ArsR family regulator
MSLEDEGRKAGAPHAEEPTVQLRALAHPVRLRILSLLTGAAMTAAEVARELGTTHANASYHLRQLADAGEVAVVSHESIRGGKAKRYRYTPPPQCPPPAVARDHRMVHAAMIEELRRRSGLFRPGPRNRTSDAELWVDEQAWADAIEAIQRASRQLHEAAQPPHSAGTTRVSMTIALFEMRDEEME